MRCRPIGIGRIPVLIILTSVYIFYQIDKLIFGPLAPAIQEDLSLSDSEIGLLTGSAATWFTLAFGIPLAHLSDRWDRVYVLSLGLFTWSSMTLCASFSHTFPEILLSRIGVGIGEAACTAPAYSLISELFDARTRGRALSIFTMAIYISEGITYSLGGFLDERYGWRTALVAFGAPGIAFTLVVLGLVVDPKREATRRMKNGRNVEVDGAENAENDDDGGAENETSSPENSVTSSTSVQPYNTGSTSNSASNSNSTTSNSSSFANYSLVVFLRTSPKLKELRHFLVVLRTFLSSRVLIILSIAAGIRMWSGYSLGFWVVTFYKRVHNKDVEDVGFFLAVLIPVAGLISASIGGYVSDRWVRVSFRAQALTAALGSVLAVPFITMCLLTDSFSASLGFLFASMVFSECWIGPAVALVQRTVAPATRSTISSIYLFIINLIGSFGTLAVGRVNESKDDEKFIRYSLVINVAGFYALSGLGFFLAAAVMRYGDIYVSEPIVAGGSGDNNASKCSPQAAPAITSNEGAPLLLSR